MLQWLYTSIPSVYLKCFIFFRSILQAFYPDIVVVIHICYKRMFQKCFICFRRMLQQVFHVSSVYAWMGWPESCGAHPQVGHVDSRVWAWYGAGTGSERRRSLCARGKRSRHEWSPGANGTCVAFPMYTWASVKWSECRHPSGHLGASIFETFKVILNPPSITT
jgi:hypothetical protein